MKIQDYYENRLMTARNSHQGKFPKVLAICSAGLLRSATLAFILAREPYNCNVRNCGVYPDYALVVLDQVLIEWADYIIFAETEHYKYAKQKFALTGADGALKSTIVLGIPDNYAYRDPELIEIINKLLIFNRLDKILTKS